MTILEPESGSVLVELGISEFGNIPVPEKQHDSMTWGKVIAVNEMDTDKEYLIGRIAFWRKYKDDARVPDAIAEGKRYVWIQIEDILGTAYEGSVTSN
jgi:co-chaperonin GroES (HSP10)